MGRHGRRSRWRRRLSRITRAGTPERTCIGCRRKAGQVDLVRVVLRADGSLAAGRALPGRGAWLCAGSLGDCAREAKRRKAFARAFRTTVDGSSVDALLHVFGSSTPGMADLLAAEGPAVAGGNHQKG